MYANRITGEFRTEGERRAGRCASLAAKKLAEMEDVKAAAGADRWHAGLSLQMPGARIAAGERVTLRTVEEEDVAFHQRAMANPELRVPIGNPLLNREQVEVPNERDRGDHQFLVCLDDAGPGSPEVGEVTRIGVVYVGDADWRRPELGYWLVPEVHGEGYGKEAVSLVIDFVFDTYDHPAVGAQAFDFNDASRGLLESLGFSEEGRIRKDRFIDGAYRDMVRYGLLRREWRERE